MAIQPGTSALLESVVELEYLVLVPPGEQLQQAGNTLVIERARPKPGRLNAEVRVGRWWRHVRRVAG